jgi:hypothetical protein
MKDLEGLRLQALLSIAKGDFIGHPFRGNQWTRNASRGRAAPKDPTAGSQGGGSRTAGLPPELKDWLKRTNDEFENEVLEGLDEGFKKELRQVFQSSMREGERIVNEETKTSGAVTARLAELSRNTNGIFGPYDVAQMKGQAAGMVIASHWKYRVGSETPIGLRPLPASAKDILARVKETKAKSGKLSPREQKQVDFIEEAKLSPKAIEHYLSLSDTGKAKYKIWHRTSELMAELRTSQYKGYANPRTSETIREALKSKGLLGTGSTPKPASSTAPKPTKKKTKKEKDAEWEALTAKQKKIYEKAPADMSHDDAMALALGL